MNPDSIKSLERKVQATAREFVYPPSPDLLRGGLRIIPQVQRPMGGYRLTLRTAALVVVLVLLVSSLAVPAARAAVINWLQLGGIIINPVDPIPPEGSRDPSRTPTPIASLQELHGLTTIQDARENFGYPVLLPEGYPQPDYVYLQNMGGGKGVLMLWMAAGEVERSFLQLSPGSFAFKGRPETISETTVNGTQAWWMTGDHLLVLEIGAGYQYDVFEILVTGNVLVWEVDRMTYRLDTVLELEEATAFAESFK